jgi:ATP-dependent Clp protease ATP-binding subunit ClpA
MQIYQIFIPELHSNVKFKVLTTTEAEEFLSKQKPNDKNLKKSILQLIVFNLNTDVVASLNMMSRIAAERAIEAIYAGCIMLNPSLDVDYWINIAYSTAPTDNLDDEDDVNIEKLKSFIRSASTTQKRKKTSDQTARSKKMSKDKFLGLEHFLKTNVIGQDEAIDEIVSTLYRSQADIHDENRPTGVFLFAGSSGVGKTYLCSMLHKYMYGDSVQMVRMDCGEFQHKHENQKLLGSPPGYVGHDEGGQLTNQVKKNPYTVVLIDEVEKAHQDIWNTFLRVFDEGIITDSKGELVDFRNTIIIMTTNLGNDKIVDGMISTGTGFNAKINFDRKTLSIPSRSVVEKNTNEAINKYFKPEFINRIDKIVVFNHLTHENCVKIAQLEMNVIANKLSKKGISLHYTDNAIDALISKGIDTVKGARAIAQVRRDTIETPMAKLIVNTHIPKGTIFNIDYFDDDFVFELTKPVKSKKANLN